MSQNTSMLITKEFPESIPKDIVHFFDNGYLLLPIDYFDVTSLVDHFVTFSSLEELIAKTEDEYLDVVRLIDRLQLKTFVLFHYSEHGDCPIDFYQLVIKEGEILKHTIKNVDENDEYYAETMLGYFTTESDFDVSNYGDYKSSFSRYQAILYWDENPAYEILSSLPAFGPIYHSVTHNGMAFHSEGFVIRFYNPDKTNWVANFQPGITSLNTIVDLDRHLFLVISGGSCYVMHPGLKNPISNFGDSYEVILKRKNGGYVLQDSTRLTIVASNGAYWHSVQISYDGIKELSLDESGLVKGVSYYPTPDDDKWIPFTYDIEKRKLIGGTWNENYNPVKTVSESSEKWWEFWK
jgi:hypothetical protein